MHPVLFRFHGLVLYSYGALTALAMIASLVIAERRAEKFGLEKRQAADVLFTLFIFGVAGARLFYVIQHWGSFGGDWKAMLRIQEGGLVWYGGLFVAIAGGMAYARWRGWPVLKLADFFAPISAMAHGIGRIGCFFNGCCYGWETTSFLGVRFTEDGAARLPVQLFEAAGLFLVAGVLFAYARRAKGDGRVLGAYLSLYGLLRFLIEFLRGDNDRYLHLTIPQWMSLALLAAGLYLWKRPRR